MALREGVSLNQFLANAIAAKVGATNYHNQLLRRLDSFLMSQATIMETKANRKLDVIGLNLNLALIDKRLSPTDIQWADRTTTRATTGNPSRVMRNT